MKFSTYAIAATMMACVSGFGVAPSFAVRQVRISCHGVEKYHSEGSFCSDSDVVSYIQISHTFFLSSPSSYYLMNRL